MGLIFSCNVGLFLPAGLPDNTLERSGTSVVWTGVIPPTPAPRLPPQKPRPTRRGDIGRSLCTFGVSKGLFGGEGELLDAPDVNAAGTAGRGAGGGRTGVSMRPLPSSNAFLSAEISWRSARFSDLVLPSSLRMASIRRSRSAMSPSRVVMYSRGRALRKRDDAHKARKQTFSPDAEVPCADLVAQLSLLFRGHLLVFLRCRTPVIGVI